MNFDGKFDKRNLKTEFSEEALHEIIESSGLSPRVTKVLPLLGGFSHINYRLETEDGDFVLRLPQRSDHNFDTEITILKALQKDFPVPEVVWTQKNVAILRYIEGRLLCHVEDDLDDEQISFIGTQLGELLAQIHSMSFHKSGFLGEGFKVTEPFTNFYDGYFGHMLFCLNSKQTRKRLDKQTLSRLKKYVNSNSATIKNLTHTNNLTHSDFNQKNILIDCIKGQWKVTAILDWEFAYSGAPLGDLGNFFRYPEVNPNYKNSFANSYETNGGVLSKNWEREARFLDLLPMLQFLSCKDNLPNTFATARSVINNTLTLDD